MEVIIAKDYEQLSRTGALLIAGQVVRKPHSVLGLATGSTPLGTYRQLVAYYREGLADFSRTQVFNLDEYRGVGGESPCSYQRYMAENLFDHINVSPGNTHIPNGLASDVAAECQRYEQLIKQAGGIDLQLLGLGDNGHIGFNEPNTHFPAATHLVELAPATIAANSRFFTAAAAVPRQAISMGIQTIFQARQIVLLASGASKAKAVKAMLEGPITPAAPASVLQLHSQLTVILDPAAAGLLAGGA